MIILSQTLGEIVGSEQEIVVDIIIDTPLDLPAQNALSPYKIVCPSTARCVSGERFMMRSNGSWVQQPDTHLALDLTGYYTIAQTDSAIASAVLSFQNTADNRYKRIGTGETVADGTNLDKLTQPGKYRNANANNGCSNMPSEVAGRPFTVDVENTYSSSRSRQTLWLGQSGFIDRFYWRTQYTSGGVAVWSSWYKVTGTAV